MNKNLVIEAIIPTHNTDKEDLRKCFESIMRQSYKNFRIYIVEDGSTEEKKKELKELLANCCDDRFSLIEHEGSGVSAARNAGMEKLSADLLTFIDSDDELEDGIWEKVVKYYQEYDIDCLVFGWTDFFKDGQYTHRPRWEPQLVSSSEAVIQIASNNYLCGGGYPWNKVWNLEKLVEVHGQVPLFDSALNRYEDKLWTLMAMDSLGSVLLVPDVGYRYNYQESSLTQDEATIDDRVLLSYVAYKKILDFLQNKNQEAYICASNFCFKFTREDLERLKNDPTKQGIYKEAKKEYKTLCKRIAPRTLRYPLFSKEFCSWLWNHYL